MEATRRQKIEDTLIKIITVAACLFMHAFSIACAIMCIICTIFIFKDTVNLLGAAAFGGVAIMAWQAAKDIR